MTLFKKTILVGVCSIIFVSGIIFTLYHRQLANVETNSQSTSQSTSASQPSLQSLDSSMKTSVEPPIEPPRVSISGQVFQPEIVETEADQEKGLSGRRSLEKDSMMVFVFKAPQRIGIWMKDMRIPIDIMWLDADWRVITVRKSVSPATYPTVFYPDAPAKYVLEVAAGTALRLNIAPGTQVERNDIMKKY